MAQKSSSHVPFSTPASRTPASESESVSETYSSKSSRTLGLEHDSDTDLDTHEVATLISKFWGVQDSFEVVLEFGVQKILNVHRRMKSMSRKQKLTHIENTGGYFMSCLIGRPAKPSVSPIDDPRSDEYGAEMERLRRERGGK